MSIASKRRAAAIKRGEWDWNAYVHRAEDQGRELYPGALLRQRHVRILHAHVARVIHRPVGAVVPIRKYLDAHRIARETL